MKTIKNTTTYNGIEIVVEAIYGDQENIINADGDRVNIGSEFKKTITVTIFKDGKTLASGDYGTMFCRVIDRKIFEDCPNTKTPKDAYARIGGIYVKEETWNVIAEAIAAVEQQIVEPEKVINPEVTFIKNPAYAHLTDAEIKQAEMAYDNLQNEGFTDSYNPYRDLLYIEDQKN